jgi:ribokinase
MSKKKPVKPKQSPARAPLAGPKKTLPAPARAVPAKATPKAPANAKTAAAPVPAVPAPPPAPPTPLPPAVASIPAQHLHKTGVPVVGMPLLAISSTGPGRASTVGTKSGVVVVGSLNMDLVVRTESMPQPGQTVMGQDLLQNAGGKGGNQAAAVGRLWAKRGAGAKMVARIGDDLFGQNVVNSLHRVGVDTTSVLTTKNVPSGTAMILVDRHGENAIVVAGGANRHLSATDLLQQRKTIESSVVLLAQLEVPADTIACGFALAKRSNVLTLLDPAPAPAEGIPESLYHCDIFMPNQTEAYQLSGIQVRTLDDARRAAERFLMRGSRIVVMKMGSQGAVIIYREENPDGTPKTGGATIAQHVAGFRVQAVDTTGAGDAFAGALAVGLAEGMALAQAVRFANAAGALACTKLGAMASMPPRQDVDNLVAGIKP